MAPSVMAPCGFLAGHLPCVGGLAEADEDWLGREVYECAGLVECHGDGECHANGECDADGEKCEVLMPHDLYQSIDYSINISTSPADVCNDLPTVLYAEVLPKSKRLLSNNALECLEDQVKPNIDIDVDDNCKWKQADVSLPRETQHVDLEQSIRHESECAKEPSYICISPGNSRRTTETETAHQSKLSSNSGASQIAGRVGRYHEEFLKHEKLLKKLSVLRSLKLSGDTPESKRKKGSDTFQLQLPPVCGKSPPCDCPEDQLYAAKLRIRILKKISTLRQRHIRLRVMQLFW